MKGPQLQPARGRTGTELADMHPVALVGMLKQPVRPQQSKSAMSSHTCTSQPDLQHRLIMTAEH